MPRCLNLISGLTLLMLIGCGEPPTLQPSAPPAPASPATAPTTTTGTTSTTSGTTTTAKAAKPTPNAEALSQLAGMAIVTPRPEVTPTAEALQAARAKLPKDAPEDAEIVGTITPGKRGGQIVYSVGAEPKSFNPVIQTNAGDQEAQGLMFGSLTGYDSYFQHDTPGLAKSWSFDEPTLTWTFNLRKGVKWSDGAPLTADDFLFFTQLIFDPKITNDLHYFLRKEAKDDSPPYEFSAPDPYTLKVKIPAVDSFSFLNLGLVKPMPRHKLEPVYRAGKFMDAWLQNVNPAELVVCGPFKLKELRPGEAMIFERNPQFYRYDMEGTQLPYVDQLIISIVPDSQAQHVNFLAGKLDLQEGIEPQMLPEFVDKAAAGNFTVYPLGASLNSNHYWFNVNRGGTYTGEDGKQAVWKPTKMGETAPGNLKDYKPFVSAEKLHWFSNSEFRIACSEATNRQRIINTVLYGLGEPLYGLVSPANREWYNPAEPKYPYKLAAAKARLDKLGWVDKNGDGLREDDQGRTIRFQIISNRENRVRERVLYLLQEDLRALGLDVTSQVVQFNNLITRVSDSFDYDVVLLGLSTGVPPHPAMAGNTWRSAGDNHLGFPNQKAPQTEWEAKIDQLYEEMKRTFDPKEQQKLCFEMQRIFNEQQSAVFLFSGKSFVAAKNSIGNLKPTVIRSSVTHNIDELYIK